MKVRTVTWKQEVKSGFSVYQVRFMSHRELLNIGKYCVENTNASEIFTCNLETDSQKSF
jgi:hypothetical protein